MHNLIQHVQLGFERVATYVDGIRNFNVFLNSR